MFAKTKKKKKGLNKFEYLIWKIENYQIFLDGGHHPLSFEKYLEYYNFFYEFYITVYISVRWHNMDESVKQ